MTNPVGVNKVLWLLGVSGCALSHHADMAAAAEAFAERKYGVGGPFNCATPGTWSDSRGFHGSAHVRGVSGAVCTRHLRQVLGERADGVHHELRFRPTTWGPDFYDRFFKPGAYLRTHAEHMERWYDQPEKE